MEGKIGGDSDLSERGQEFARLLPNLIQTNLGDKKLTVLIIVCFNKVWTSTLKRTMRTASLLPYPKLSWKALDELDAGACDSMTYQEIEVALTSLY